VQPSDGSEGKYDLSRLCVKPILWQYYLVIFIRGHISLLSTTQEKTVTGIEVVIPLNFLFSDDFIHHTFNHGFSLLIVVW
jgi:hypothetical protein